MITVATVLKTGGEYRREHVHALKRGLERHLSDFNFVCLTDNPTVEHYWRVPLKHGWPGWWSKLELFTPGLFKGRVLYLDLDSVIVGDLSEIAAYRGPFAMLSDFNRPEGPASGVMAWDAECSEGAAIWKAFIQDPDRAMAVHEDGGDQSFMRSVVGDHTDRLQALYPNQIVSYKRHCRGKGVPDGARVICAHGKPKPWDAEWEL